MHCEEVEWSYRTSEHNMVFRNAFIYFKPMKRYDMKLRYDTIPLHYCSVPFVEIGMQ